MDDVTESRCFEICFCQLLNPNPRLHNKALHQTRFVIVLSCVENQINSVLNNLSTTVAQIESNATLKYVPDDMSDFQQRSVMQDRHDRCCLIEQETPIKRVKRLGLYCV